MKSVTSRPSTANWPSTPVHWVCGLYSVPTVGPLIFSRLEIIVYWPCNHHMTFLRALASLKQYRESLPDRSLILLLLQLKNTWLWSSKRMCDGKGKSISKLILLSFSIYHKPGCYNSPPLIECNTLVALHDKSQNTSRVRTEMANLALKPLITPWPPTINGPPTPVLSARGPHPIRRSVR